MKKLLVIISLFLISCDDHVNCPLQEGTISEVRKTPDGSFIRVVFPLSCSRDMFHSEWFVGADTCKVGQIVNLK